MLTERALPGPPLLAVEVLSPSTHRFDLPLKHERLQDAAVPSCWLLDPDEPSVAVLELVDGVYSQVARAVGNETCEVRLPFPIRIVPAELLA